MGYIVQAQGAEHTFSFVVQESRRGYKWVEGDEGIRAAARFATVDDAVELILKHPTHVAMPTRVVKDPLSAASEKPARRRGFLIGCRGTNGREYYVVLQEGTLRWAQGQTGKARAFRFKSAEMAGRATLSGFRGVAGGRAEVIKVNR